MNNNYRNNMPHYDSMPHHYNPMGISDFKTSNNKMKSTNSMPGMPDVMFEMPFIPETEIPLEINGDMPALPSMPGTQMPNGMPGMPQLGIPGLIPPWMPQNGMPIMPGLPQTQMPMMPAMPNGMPMMPGMPQTQMPGMPPSDGNMYPVMPENGVPPVTCEQLRELLRWMNCPINGNGDENGPVPPTDEDI